MRQRMRNTITVTPQLIVVPAPSLDEAFERM